MKRIILAGILIIGFILRVFGLQDYPAGFTPDEAAFGYNAYSLLQTGRDEWGTPWYSLPFTNLRSFGDYKLPLYAFLAVPTVKLFGLNEFATRLPNAIFGSLAIPAIYLFSVKLFGNLKNWKLFARKARPEGRTWNLNIGHCASFILAVSPWHIQLSRGAFEANLIVLFLPLAISLFFARRYTLSAVILAVSFYSYHSARLLTPLIPIFLFVFTRKVIYQFILLLLLLLLPGLWSMLGPGSVRLADVGLFSPTDNWQGVSDQRFAARNLGLPDPVARMFSNKATQIFSQSVENYTSYFSPQFLLSQGPSEATYGMIQGRGVIYLIESVFLAGFVVLLVRNPNRNLIFLFLLLLLSPLPAALSKGSGLAANRAASMIPFLSISLALGAGYLARSFRRIPPRLIIVAIGVLYLVHLAFFYHEYRYLAPRNSARSMSYGWREATSRLFPIADRFWDIRISRVFSEPHIFLAFYLPYPPAEYQQNARTWPDFLSQGYKFLDQVDGYYLGKFRFGDIHPQDTVKLPTLFVGPPSQFPENFPEYFHIDYPDGRPAIKVAEKKP